MKTSFVYILSRTLGIYPFDEDGLSRIWLTASAALQILTATAYGFNFLNIYNEWGKLKLSNYVDLILTSVQWSATTVTFFRAVMSAKVFATTATCARRKPPPRVDVVLAVALIYKLLLLPVLYTDVNDAYKLMKSIEHIIQSNITFIIALQFVCFMSVKSEEAKKLVNRLEKYPVASCSLLWKLSEEVEGIHEAFGPQLLLVMSKFMCSAVYSGYQGLRLREPLKQGIFLTVALENLCSVLMIQWSCSDFNQQVMDFYSRLFCHIWACEWTNRKLCLYATVQRKVEFRTCGLFTMGYPLFTSAVAATATYFVIILQFE